MDNRLNPQYIGQRLIERGFKTWFLYVFRMIEGKEFIQEPMHSNIFEVYEAIDNCETKRNTLNLCPRSGKTTIATYFLAWLWIKNPKANSIYSSFSQSLLGTIAIQLKSILENDKFKAMYNIAVNLEDEKLSPIDNFWKEVLAERKKQEEKNRKKKKKKDEEISYSNKKIINPAGGTILFASAGSAITGFGAGVRGAEGCSGILILDDLEKPQDIRSEVIRAKTKIYYTETLLSRLNDSSTPILNIQQRLHIDDISAYLKETYSFNVTTAPLLINGICQLPNQYTEERIKELQINNYVFQSQYQQDPILAGGNLIKTEWFQRYSEAPEKFRQMYIVCDTAFSTKKTADNSAFMLAGIDHRNFLYVLDIYTGKVGFTDLKRNLKAFYEKARTNYGRFNTISTIYIEDKASGQSLLQELKEELPIQPIYPKVFNKHLQKEERADKVTRFYEIESDLVNGLVYLPESAPWLLDFIKESESFDGLDKNHDDMIDCLIYSLKVKRKRKTIDWGETYEVLNNLEY